MSLPWKPPGSSRWLAVRLGSCREMEGRGEGCEGCLPPLTVPRRLRRRQQEAGLGSGRVAAIISSGTSKNFHALFAAVAAPQTWPRQGVECAKTKRRGYANPAGKRPLLALITQHPSHDNTGAYQRHVQHAATGRE